MESCSNQKGVKQIKIYFRFLKIATICLDDSFAHSGHSLNQLHLECFSNNSSEGVPTYAEHLLADFSSLHGPTHLKPSQLGWGWVIVEARSSDAALHHSPWSNSPYTAWRCVLGHCPVEKQIIVSLRANQMGWRIAAECCGRQCHQQKTQTVSPAKDPTPSHLLLHASWWEPHMQRLSVHLLCISERHGGWN